MPLALIATVAVVAPGPLPSSAPTDPFNEPGLAAALWTSSPEVVSARGAVADARAVAERSELLPNPTLTATWGTIPVGRRPPGVAFGDVPNYSLGASQLFELGKRGPRQAAARAGADEARLFLGDLYRGRFLDVLKAIGDESVAAGHTAILERLVEASQGTLTLQKLREAKGDVAGLEVDRLEVEHLRLLSALGEARAAMEEAAAACALLLGQSCPPVRALDDALKYLASDQTLDQLKGGRDDEAIARRPDLQALQAAERRLRYEGLLARRQKIPDPTLSLAATHDTFTSAGNQSNSLTLSLALPLPIFDRGQPEVARAAARAQLATRQRETLTEAARRALVADRRRLDLLSERAKRLDEQAIPMARATAERVEAAARRGGAALQDVLLARRAMEELQLDRVDVAAQSFSARLEIRRAAGSVPEPPGGF
ncbi:MAG: TolC family protein [Polyangia bacterium]